MPYTTDFDLVPNAPLGAFIPKTMMPANRGAYGDFSQYTTPGGVVYGAGGRPIGGAWLPAFPPVMQYLLPGIGLYVLYRLLKGRRR